MGCGESKQSVATSNTVGHRKKLNLTIKRSRVLETIPENDNSNNSTNSSVQESGPRSTDKDLEIDKGVAVADVKHISVNAELKEENKEGVGVEGKEAQKLESRDSPDHYYFSPRRDDDGIESSVGDEELEYLTPRHELDKDGEVKEKADDALEEEGLVGEEDKKADAESAAGDLKEPATIKEANVVSTTEAKAVTTIEDKKIIGVTEEQSSDMSPKDTKTN